MLLESGHRDRTRLLLIVHCLELSRWDVPDRLQETSVVEPVYPGKRLQLDRDCARPRPNLLDDFRFYAREDSNL